MEIGNLFSEDRKPRFAARKQFPNRRFLCQYLGREWPVYLERWKQMRRVG
jgi:hypothetical protein